MAFVPARNVAIVVIGRNEGDRLKGCLRSVMEAAGTVVYVDSGSHDGSAEYARSVGCRVFELDPARPFSATRARNEGFACATEHDPDVPFVQFLDGNCEVFDGWLEQGVDALTNRPDAAIVCGQIREIHPEASVYNKLRDLESQQAPGVIRTAGGSFMVRAEVFRAVNGFRPDLLAAEDDEFCLRVRELGSKILRLDAQMARHDAVMTSFGQWGRRVLRAGYAYAQIAALHGDSKDRYFVSHCRKIWLWGLLLPAVALACAPFTHGLSLLVGICAYALQFAWICCVGRKRGWQSGDAMIYASFTVLRNFPASLGMLEYHWRQLRGSALTLIDYKRSSASLKRLTSSLVAGKSWSPRSSNSGVAGSMRRVAFAGAGDMAEWHVKAIASVANVELVAVCDLTLTKAQALAARFGVPRAYGSLQAMLAEEKLDAVHILLPSDLHFEAARAVLEAGVGVFLEKPMCARAADCDTLVRIAAERTLRLGVGHNFLFAEPYEQLWRDMRSGVLGRIDDVTITWNRPLSQIAHGPFDTWMLRDPRNILSEIGSHSVAHMLDLVGEPDELQVQPSNPVDLPTGRIFYRHWHVNACKGRTAVELRFSFVPGFAEHTIHVRGSLAAATVDFERSTYTLHEHHPADPEFETYIMVSRETKGLRRQARRTLLNYVLSKGHLYKRGNPYSASIARAMDAFYDPRGLPLDERVDGLTGANVIRVCERMELLARFPIEKPVPTPVHVAVPSRIRSVPAPAILVLGGTGFIGGELVSELIEAGRAVRVLVRRPAGIPQQLKDFQVDCWTGDLMNRQDLLRAMAGIDFVFHLARANVKRWAEYQEFEIGATRQVAECALEAGVKRLIYIGTTDSYYAGSKAGTINEDTPLDPKIAQRNLHARAKAASEELLMRMHRERGLPIVILRPGIVIGRGGNPFHPGIGKWWNDAICQMWGDGNNKLPLVLVEDVAQGLIAAMKKPGIEGKSFNLVAAPCLSAQDYLDELDRACKTRIQRHATPILRFYLLDMVKWAAKVALRHPGCRLPSYRDWESRTQRAFFDCTAARTVLDWDPFSERKDLVRRGIETPLMEIMR